MGVKLKILGNDIVALSSAFARRDASEIKRKFNRENRLNSHKIDQLLAVHATGESTWDVTHLREKDEEYHVKMDELENEKKRKREERVQRQIQRFFKQLTILFSTIFPIIIIA